VFRFHNKIERFLFAENLLTLLERPNIASSSQLIGTSKAEE
jgi:hypothetical protein